MRDNMEYVKLFWKHDYPDDPVVIIYEVDIDDERYAVKLIDIFADGHTINQEDKGDTLRKIPCRLSKNLMKNIIKQTTARIFMLV